MHLISDASGSCPISTSDSVADDIPPRTDLVWVLSPTNNEAQHETDTTVTFRGTISQISTLGQFLCWVAASFRLPQSDVVACSSVNFRALPSPGKGSMKFEITLETFNRSTTMHLAPAGSRYFQLPFWRTIFPSRYFPDRRGFTSPWRLC